MSLFVSKYEPVVVGNHLHEKSPSAQKSTHQKSQGKTENHQENKVLGHP
jgi:hypothetical protein